jgi:hypothetical protein
MVPPPLSDTVIFGFTIKDAVNTVALQLLAAAGVILKVIVCGEEVVFTSVAAGMVPVPLAAIPVMFPVVKSPFVLVQE